jgi:hypothetical protein
VKNIKDLVASAETVCARYRAGRMERETVREWVLGLGAYPPPHGDRIREAVEWFRTHGSDSVSDEIRVVDLDRLSAIFAP